MIWSFSKFNYTTLASSPSWERWASILHKLCTMKIFNHWTLGGTYQLGSKLGPFVSPTHQIKHMKSEKRVIMWLAWPPSPPHESNARLVHYTSHERFQCSDDGKRHHEEMTFTASCPLLRGNAHNSPSTETLDSWKYAMHELWMLEVKGMPYNYKKWKWWAW